MDNAKCGNIILVHAFSQWTFYKSTNLKLINLTSAFFFFFWFPLVEVLEIANRHPEKGKQIDWLDNPQESNKMTKSPTILINLRIT